MIVNCASQGASLCILLLQVAVLNWPLISALSVSSAGTKNNIVQTQMRHNNNQNSIQYSQLQAPSVPQPAKASPATTLPPLLTTIAQEMKLSNQQTETQHSIKQLDQHSKQRSSADPEHDDSIPLATVNNHSRNQPVARPPQYVDVAALVGRNQSNQTSGLSNVTSSGLGPASGLTAKSRSGLPECATQQVCNAIFVRMNYTQRLCECSSNYNWKCSHNLDPQDGHTIELTRKFDKRIYTQIKTCEPLREVRACKSPTDWTLLALQSERSGKAHYVVVCKCPTWAQLEGPYTHNHPPYANIPGIRVYGMLCAHQTARSSAQTYAAYNPALSIYPEFPWSDALNVLNTTNLASALDSH